MGSILRKLLIRQRIWALVLLSMLGLALLATIAIQQAQNQFMEMKQEQYVKLTDTAKQLINFYYQAAELGELDNVQARKLAKEAVKSLALDNRNYFYIYNRTHGLMVAHPFIAAVYSDDTPEQIAASVKYDREAMATFGETLGLGRPALSGFDVFKKTHSDNYTGFFEYYLYLTEEKQGVVQEPDDPNLSEQAELKMGYGTLYEPWDWVIFTSVYLDDVKESFYSWLINMVTVSAVIIIALFLFAFAISRSITKPLHATVELMSDISSGTGDLTKRLDPTGSDELSQLAGTFNIFVEKISTIVQHVTSANENIMRLSQQMTTVMQSTVGRSESQLSETELLASASNELSYSVKSVAERANESSEAAQSTEQSTSQAQNSMAKNIHSIQQLADALLNTQSQVTSMETFSNKVSSVLEVIVGIAEQTNLLALNAAIEAARAGEQGRGFAVVADEVRTLAQRTQSSTAEIHSIIENLQSGTENVVRAMKDGLDHSEICVKTATEASDVLQQVIEYVSKITQMNIQIASAVDEQSKVTLEIAQSSQTIANTSKETLDAANSNMQSSHELNNDSRSLNDLVAQFKV
ncbi:methyl-accepting chemotaxis protein [Aurantivibrio plasticivorans]